MLKKRSMLTTVMSPNADPAPIAQQAISLYKQPQISHPVHLITPLQNFRQPLMTPTTRGLPTPVLPPPQEAWRFDATRVQLTPPLRVPIMGTGLPLSSKSTTARWLVNATRVQLTPSLRVPIIGTGLPLSSKSTTARRFGNATIRLLRRVGRL